jgi:hypothetical protein
MSRRLGPVRRSHLGPAVSALLDGHLDPAEAERWWAHVASCDICARQVERESWIKRRLASLAEDAPSSRLLGSLYSLAESAPQEGWTTPPEHIQDERSAWVAVSQLEERARARRRTGLAVVGVGSVSAAVLGLASLGGALGGSPAGRQPAPPVADIARPSASATPTPRSGGASLTGTGSPAIPSSDLSAIPSGDLPATTSDHLSPFVDWSPRPRGLRR